MKHFVLMSALWLTFGAFAQDKNPILNMGNKEVPCYERAQDARRRGVDLIECGKLAGVVDCNEELEYNEEANIFVKRAKDNVNRAGAGTPYSGSCESCFMSGLLERRVTFLNGKEHGIDTAYYKSGCIQAIRSHLQGAESGQWKYFYDSTQQLSWEMNYAVGEKHGQHIYFNKKGDTTKLETYNNGVLHGVRKTYYKNGKLYRLTTYARGLMDGPYKMYNEQGVLIEDGTYLAGNKHGNYRYFFEDGKILRTENWDNGNKVGEFKMFYHQGHVQTLETYNKKSQQDGRWEEYYPDNKPKRRAVYLKGVLIEDHQYDVHGTETYTFGGTQTSEAEDDQMVKGGKKPKAPKKEKK